MPLFILKNSALKSSRLKNFATEKELQNLIEKNIEIVFNSKFIATEFSTGATHAGRIDTLALSEDNNPVIIEYKKVESSDLINQSLFYLSWLSDHKGDFELAARNVLGNKIEVDWSEIRVICIAPGYKKYDLHAVQMMGANIELWEYKKYDDDILYLEEIFRKQTLISDTSGLKNPVMVEAGKKAAITRATGVYSFEDHLNKAGKEFSKLINDLNDYIINIDDSIEMQPKKLYIAYKKAQNFVCVEVQKTKLVLFLKLQPKDIEIEGKIRDVSNIGHYGTGDIEFKIENEGDMEKAKELIKLAYENIGG